MQSVEIGYAAEARGTVQWAERGQRRAPARGLGEQDGRGPEAPGTPQPCSHVLGTDLNTPPQSPHLPNLQPPTSGFV